MNRRQFIKATSLASLSYFLPGAGWAFSNGGDNLESRRLIVILLRGGVDGLNVVVPYGDRNYHALRPSIALPSPGSGEGVIDLDGYFGVHPALEQLLPFWRGKSLAFVHACGSPDPSRSHFDAQDYMESGMPGQKSASTGWLNRTVSLLPSKHSPLQAISLGPVLPRIFAGPAAVSTVEKNLKNQNSVLDRPVIGQAFQELYAGRNDAIARAFNEGVASHKTLSKDLSDMQSQQAQQAMNREQIMANRGAPLPRNNPDFGRQLANLFRQDNSVQVAFADFGGWDTHVNEGTGRGQLANHLQPLAGGLADLANGLGPLYKYTTIVVMSEFGRTAHENGNGGTDHGHGNVMWLLGGDVPGGKVYGRWSGLAPNDLHEQRDLPTSTDFRAVLSYLLYYHMELPKPALAKIFPDFQITGNPFVQT